MKKIPTLFIRDPETHQVVDKLAVALPPNAIATRKWDGTAAMVLDGVLYQRYTLRTKKRKLSTRNPGGDSGLPADFIPTGDPDGTKQPGWRPVPSAAAYSFDAPIPRDNGTYELIGPKVQGNAERRKSHAFMRHGAELVKGVIANFNYLAEYLSEAPIEGIVWWANGEPVAKIKRRDFGFQWPLAE
ncbi:MAG TPA: DUF5565 family protein [Acidobacteriaceae bacterium]|nr:DUF5565 family protein [Acidobacteriaceae bacterium]